MKTAVVDLDGVICEERPTFERPLATEVFGARRMLKSLRAAGYRIIIHTARSWSELSMTEQWLFERSIPYDQLVMGKPVADIVVDDRAVASLEEAVASSERRLPDAMLRERCVAEPMPKEKLAEVQEQEPVAWAAVAKNGKPMWLSYSREGAEGAVFGAAEVVPLYRTPQTCPYVVGRTTLRCSLTPLGLTDEEREYITCQANRAWHNAEEAAARGDAIWTRWHREEERTLRGLLERLG